MEAIFCGVDRGCDEAIRHGGPGGETNPSGGDFRAHVLSLEKRYGVNP